MVEMSHMSKYKDIPYMSCVVTNGGNEPPMECLN